jgi:tRNA threonylcarbamoyl adenosine modification protein YjeE
MTDRLTESQLEALAGELAATLPAHTVVRLEGPLGAGKTTFVRAFARARGAAVDATSPTYTLAHRYPSSRGDVWHLDCYRMRDAESAADLDWELMAGADALLVEWPERAGSYMLPSQCTVVLEHVDELHRRVQVIR